MKQLFNNKIFLAITFIIIGFMAGWLFFKDGGDRTELTKHAEHQMLNESVWTCAMHPQIRQGEMGDCPICGMELIPVKGFSAGPNMVEMSQEASKLANIQTTVVGFTLPEKDIFLQGKVQVDERNVSNQTSHFTGRIDKLFVSFTGETVETGQKLASVYSPELVTAQKELFEAIKTKDKNPKLYNAARNKISQWKLTDAQIDAIEKGGIVLENVDIRADISGVVLKRNVSVGDHVMEGSVLFTIVDLSKVWVEFDAYEADIPWLKIGDKIKFTVISLPGVEFNQKVTFIDPIINPQTRTASVRLEVNNKNGKLKPEMFTSGTITTKLPIEEAQLTVPKSAVMWTGKRSVVYIAVPESDDPLFEFREITLGHDLGGYFIVEQGLSEGERVVTNGAFKVDAAAQLAGKKSMMNKGNSEVISGVNKETLKAAENIPGTIEAQIMVSGNCVMCKSRIEKAALAINGVSYAVWDKETKIISLHFEEKSTNKESIAKSIAAAGHDTEFESSTGEVYDALPACCKYTREEHNH